MGDTITIPNRHSREGGNPPGGELRTTRGYDQAAKWIPAFAGMTKGGSKGTHPTFPISSTTTKYPTPTAISAAPMMRTLAGAVGG